MDKKCFKGQGGSIFTLVELLLVLAIVWFFAYHLLKLYTRKPIRDEQAARFISSQGIDTSNPRSILNTTREKLEGISQQVKQRQSEVENMQ